MAACAVASREPPNCEPSKGQEAKAKKPQRGEAVEDVHGIMPSLLLQICSMAKVGAGVSSPALKRPAHADASLLVRRHSAEKDSILRTLGFAAPCLTGP